MNVLIAGDFCPIDRVAKLLDECNFDHVLGNVKQIVSEADYSIVNFECSVTNGNEKPISKLGPNLRCSEKGIEAVKWAGFNCVTLANNHFYDFGNEGVICTLDACNKYGIDIVGGGNNIKEASKTLYKKFGNQTIAIINCCEHEFSIATDNSGGSNPLDPIQQYYAIKEAKTKADYIILIVHGGHEHWQLPSLRMVNTYRFFIDAGADVVVNHHQHCYSGYEIYNGKPIFYGLGNFCFDNPGKRNDIWNDGCMVMLELNDVISFNLIPYSQCNDRANVEILHKNVYDERLLLLNSIIADKDRLALETTKYYEKCKKQFSNIFEPINNKYYLSAKMHGWLPSFISNKRKLRANHFISCESHRDKLLWWLNNG